MKRLALLPIAGIILAGSHVWAADQTLFSTRTATPILLDAKVDKAWDKAEPITLTLGDTPYEPDNGYAGIQETTVTLKAMHDDANLYLLITYKDPTKSLARFPWEKQADGTWKKLANKDSTGHDNTYYEDKLAMFWNINTEGFAAEGCMIACHMGLSGDKSPGRKYTNKPGETIDMWHAKFVRSMPLGMFDDQYMDNNTDPKANSGYGRKNDTSKGGGYTDNDNGAKTGPAYMNLGGAEEDKYFVIPTKRIPFVDTFKAGDIVPGIVVTPMTGSRADVLAKNDWQNGEWTIEVQRALVTEGENSDTQDVQFRDLGAAYPFGIAVFDNSQINHLFHLETLELKFK